MFDLAAAPVGLLEILLFVALAAASEAGAFARAKFPADETAGDRGDGFALPAVLALLALLVSFTFSLSLARYDTRLRLVGHEANAIETLWTRVQLLDEPGRDGVSSALGDYLDARLKYGAMKTEDEQDAAFQASQVLQQRLWSQLGDATKTFRNSPFGVLLLTSANACFDAANAREAAEVDKVPPRVMASILFFAVVAAAMIGFMAPGRRRRAPALVYLALLALALGLIVDLDRPHVGAVVVSQKPMTELRASVAAAAITP